MSASAYLVDALQGIHPKGIFLLSESTHTHTRTQVVRVYLSFINKKNCALFAFVFISVALVVEQGPRQLD